MRGNNTVAIVVDVVMLMSWGFMLQEPSHVVGIKPHSITTIDDIFR